MTQLYLTDAARPEPTVLSVPEVPTAVVRATNHPMSEMTSLFDGTFSALFPSLAAAGIAPVGPAFSLHHRIPTDTSDLEIGVPIDRPLAAPIEAGGVRIEPGVLPGGDVAAVSYLGGYDGLGEAWGAFMGAVAESGRPPAFPFWEVYVTEPTPDLDPATLRTDLYTSLG